MSRLHRRSFLVLAGAAGAGSALAVSSPAIVRAAVSSAVKGGAITTSRSRSAAAAALIPSTHAVASARVPCIFQLPASSGRNPA